MYCTACVDIINISFTLMTSLNKHMRLCWRCIVCFVCPRVKLSRAYHSSKQVSVSFIRVKVTQSRWDTMYCWEGIKSNISESTQLHWHTVSKKNIREKTSEMVVVTQTISIVSRVATETDSFLLSTIYGIWLLM